MPHLTRRSFAALIAAAFVPASYLQAQTQRVAVNAGGTALDGYDTTAYWQRGEPRAGRVAHIVEWRGVPWQFATAKEAAMFAASPENFAPQFGGFCTRAMSFKKVVNGDPEVWRIYQGKLYVFALPVGGSKFDKEQDAMIASAQAYWETLG